MRRALLVAVVVLGLAGAAYAATASGPQTYAGPGIERTGLRPTGIGLPLIGATGTIGASELSSSLRSYHDSGAYARDVAKVDNAALKTLKRELAARKGGGKPRCHRAYRKVVVRVVVKGWKTRKERLYRKARACVSSPLVAKAGKPAIVLDIDETALSNYAGFSATGFTAAGAVAPAVAGTGTAITPTRTLFKAARKRKVAVFFITGRPPQIDAITQTNLRSQGFSGWKALYEKPGGTGTEAFKSGMRAKLQKRGYDILVNVGDQESDLDGGHADAAFKLPNPFYFVGDK